jgi:hypothetical protein
MLDLHTTYDATGSADTLVTEATTGTIPAGDGATTIGVSPWPGATLVAYGAHVAAAAQAITGIGLKSNNIVDPVNGLIDQANTTPTMTRTVAGDFVQLGYGSGPNLVQYGQEAAGKICSYKIDYIKSGTCSTGSWFPPTAANSQTGFAQYSVVAGGAVTAGVYYSQAFAPTTTPPVGTYAILGFRLTAVVFGAAVRFQHSDFGGAFPGCPAVSYSDQAITNANMGGTSLTSDNVQGKQFVFLSQTLGVPCCPVFRIQGQGTGLNVQFIDCAADTPQITLNLLKLA